MNNSESWNKENEIENKIKNIEDYSKKINDYNKSIEINKKDVQNYTTNIENNLKNIANSTKKMEVMVGDLSKEPILKQKSSLDLNTNLINGPYLNCFLGCVASSLIFYYLRKNIKF